MLFALLKRSEIVAVTGVSAGEFAEAVYLSVSTGQRQIKQWNNEIRATEARLC